MKNLIILTTIILALLTLTGCGGGNQAQQAAPNQADNGGQQVQGNQQANTPAPMRRNRPADTGATTQIVPQNSNIDFKKMTDDQIDQKYDQLKKSNSTTAIRFGLQAWASRFPEAASKKPADNAWSRGVMQRNRNQTNTQGTAPVQKQTVAQSNDTVRKQTSVQNTVPVQKKTSAQDTEPVQKQTSEQDTAPVKKQPEAENTPLLASFM